MGSTYGCSQSFQCKEQTCINLSWRSQQLENICFQTQQNSSSWCWWENHENHLSGFQLHAQPWAPGRHSPFLIPLPPLQDTGMSRMYHTRGGGWGGCTGHRHSWLPAHPGEVLYAHKEGLALLQQKSPKGKIRKLKKPQPLCLLVRMKMTPEFEENLIFK